MINGTSKELVGVYYESTPIKSIFKGTKLVWCKPSNQPIITNKLTGKFIDSSTSAAWFYYKNGSANTNNKVNLEVNDNKEFDIEIELEGTLAYMFFGNYMLERIDNLPVTNRITDLTNLFCWCESLTYVNCGNWDLSGVTEINNVFAYCSKLNNVDVKNWNVSNIPLLVGVFQNCSSLKSLDVSGWNTSNATSFSGLFYGCSSLQELDLTNFETGKVTNIYDMFYNCQNLKTLKLGKWDLSKLTLVDYPFYNCNNLTTIEGEIEGLSMDIDFRWCPLTNASAMVFINGLAEVSSAKTITFKASTYNTLTEEQIAIATSKGWTVAKV